MDEHLVDLVYEQVAQQLAPLPPVPVTDGDSPAQAWGRFRDRDRPPTAWEPHLPTFADERVIGALRRIDHSASLQEAFRSIVEEKIRVVTNQTLHVLRMRVKQRLYRIESDLTALVRQ
jgi:hypothetical protein